MVQFRLLRFLTILAVLVSAIGMAGSHAATAMTMPEAAVEMSHGARTDMMPDHCGGMGEKKQGPADRGPDCMVQCSGIPSICATLGELPAPDILIPPLPAQRRIAGIFLEMDTPPPRTI